MKHKDIEGFSCPLELYKTNNVIVIVIKAFPFFLFIYNRKKNLGFLANARRTF